MNTTIRTGASRSSRSRYDKRRRVLITTGRWDPWTDAQPVRDHIANLSQAGIGWMHAAELAGLSAATVGNWLYGRGDYPPPDKIHTELAEKMLAVTAHEANLANRALISSLLSIRQLQALAADGFPFSYIGARLDRDPTNMSRTMRNASIEAGSARAIAALFAELAGTNPVAVGISPRNSNYARNWAAKKGWFTSAQWDGEIQNPDANPARWIRTDTDDHSLEKLVAEAEEIRETSGASWDLIAERLNIARSTLSEARKRMATCSEAGAA